MWSNLASGALSLRGVLQSEAIFQSISKRSAESLVARGDSHGGDIMLIVLLLINIAIFVPASIFVMYTLSELLPVLAIVEDDKPPSYTPLANNDATELENSTKNNKAVPTPASNASTSAAAEEEEGGEEDPAPPVTSSIRSIITRLRAIKGRLPLFHGLLCAAACQFALVSVTFALAVIPFVPGVVALVAASLITMPLQAAWTHVAITAPSSRPFWRRIPPFRTTFRAAALPTLVLWLAAGSTTQLPLGMLTTLMGGLGGGSSRPGDAWKACVALVFYVLSWALITIPANVVLTRIQVSLLPDGDRAATIVPLDHAFAAAREEGREYMTMAEAWRTFSRPAWIRLLKLHAKIFGLSLAVYLGLAALVGVELVLVQVIGHLI
ncbi:hypothetical protein AAE478_005986 [Parahypoxylon ruwenzoriense]